jgi:hypothetical protein
MLLEGAKVTGDRSITHQQSSLVNVRMSVSEFFFFFQKYIYTMQPMIGSEQCEEGKNVCTPCAGYAV